MVDLMPRPRLICVTKKKESTNFGASTRLSMSLQFCRGNFRRRHWPAYECNRQSLRRQFLFANS